MKLNTGEVITIENYDGILHEVTVESSDDKTVTGKITFRPDKDTEITETHTFPQSRISWVGHRRLQ